MSFCLATSQTILAMIYVGSVSATVTSHSLFNQHISALSALIKNFKTDQLILAEVSFARVFIP